MDDWRLARRYLDWKPKGKRPVGRHRKTRLDGVGKALATRGLRTGDVEERRKYEEREIWRNVNYSPADR